MYNAGNGGRIDLNEAWALLQKIEGVNIPANYGPPRAGDVRDSQADTTAAVRDLGTLPASPSKRDAAGRSNGTGVRSSVRRRHTPVQSRGVLRLPRSVGRSMARGGTSTSPVSAGADPYRSRFYHEQQGNALGADRQMGKG